MTLEINTGEVDREAHSDRLRGGSRMTDKLKILLLIYKYHSEIVLAKPTD